MPPCPGVGALGGDEKLSASRSSAQHFGASHQINWQVAEQDYVDQRYPKCFAERTDNLLRKSAQQLGTTTVELRYRARNGVRSHPDVRIQEQQRVIAGRRCQLMAGELFATPTFLKRLAFQISNAIVIQGHLLDDAGGFIGAVVIKNHNLQRPHAVLGQCLKRRLNTCGLVPGGNEDGNGAIERDVTGCVPEDQAIPSKQTGDDGRESQNGPTYRFGIKHRLHSSPHRVVG